MQRSTQNGPIQVGVFLGHSPRMIEKHLLQVRAGHPVSTGGQQSGTDVIVPTCCSDRSCR